LAASGAGGFIVELVDFLFILRDGRWQHTMGGSDNIGGRHGRGRWWQQQTVV